MTLHQKVRALKTTTVTGLRIKRGTQGVVKGWTITAISESPESPVVFVRFERWVLPMRESEIEPTGEK